MKKTIYSLAGLALLTGLALTGCSTPAEKVENAKNDVEKSKADLNAANLQYEEDYAAYKKETADKIAANEKCVADYKSRIAQEKRQARDNSNRKIEVLEKRNNDMKRKLEDYRADNKDHWESFKVEFNHDMDELVKAFQDLTVNNTK
jgi:hypothetical protein